MSATPNEATVISDIRCGVTPHPCRIEPGRRRRVTTLLIPPPLTEQTMRLAEHLIAVPRRKLRTDRRLARLRPHEGRTADPQEAGLPFPAAPEVARHEHLVIVGDRDCSEVEGLVV